jgi:two-component system phosphate regulon sensor histidine kinase PhoR
MFRTIRWRIAVPYVVLIVLMMLGLSIYLSNVVRQAHLTDLESKLTDASRLVGDALGSRLAQGKPDETLDSLVLHYADLLRARVTIIGADGTVLGESHEDRTQMDNHLYRPEVQEALATGQGSSIRFSRTVGYDMMYVAVLVKFGDQVVGFARLALPLQQVEASVARLRWAILGATLVAAAMAVFLAVFIAERTARPVRELTQVAQRMAEGDLDIHIFPTTRDEIGQLTHAFDHLADQLQGKISTLADERSRLAAILDNMADGVLITDGEGRVRLINPAAARLLNTTQAGALGLSFAEVARHHRLIELWQSCRREGREQIEATDLGPGESFVRAIITLLRAEDPGGCLVILQDLTEIHRLETVRRDFLGNVSHELRTPLASLKALVDTLRDGALEDRPAAQRFLDRMEIEVDALTQIVQESLELSRIESGQAPLRLVSTPVAVLILPPVERLRPQAERAGLSITVSLPPDLPRVLADEERARQLVTNLVHNAIKFTASGGEVVVSAEPVGEEVVISVRDTGIGIPSGDLPRIFERFYKADRARSGGGTGLGLAIAKHIVQAHGGRIWAASVEGQGSTFSFSLRTAN